MKTDSLDRFGTRLENRFTKKEIHNMMEMSGLQNIKFSNVEPFGLLLVKKIKINLKFIIKLQLD